MITSKDVRNKRFEKAAFGYKQEEIDEFLNQLEAELDEMERERSEANSKIQVLADKVREYMKDEDALKDALLGAQKQGHQVLNEANEKAEQIIAEAQAKADALEDEAVRQHAEAMERNREEIKGKGSSHRSSAAGSRFQEEPLRYVQEPPRAHFLYARDIR